MQRANSDNGSTMVLHTVGLRSSLSWSTRKNRTKKERRGKTMKSFFTKLVLKFANTDLILKFAQSKLVSYIESLMTSKNVSVKLIGEKAAKAAKICSHVAILC